MTALQWLLTLEQFAALWLNNANDRMPYPVQFVSHFTDADAFRLFQRATRGNASLELLGAIDILANPELRLEIAGTQGAARPQLVRIVAARTQELAVLIAQYPGDDGEVVVRTCTPTELPELILAGLPGVGPGSARSTTFINGEVPEEDWAPYDPFSPRPAQQFYTLDDTGPLDLDLQLTCIAAPRYGSQQPRSVTRLLDVPRDGRYLEVSSLPREITRIAADPTDVRRKLQEGTYLDRPWAGAC